MQIVATICAAIAVIFMAAASALYIYKTGRGDESIRPLSSLCLVIGFFGLTFYVGATTIAAADNFWTTQNTVMFICWVTTFAYCIFEVVAKTRKAGLVILPLLTIAIAVAHFL